jgi:hypothetical protein
VDPTPDAADVPTDAISTLDEFGAGIVDSE